MLRRTCKQTMAGVDRNLAVCLLGHSYIRRLNDFMNSSSDLYNLRLDRDSYIVTTKFRGGLQVQQLASIAHFGRDVPGGNDIGSFTDDKIVSDMLSFSEYLLHGVGVQMVIIGQLLRRSPRVVPPGYNDSVIYINRQLERRTRHRDGVALWEHRGIWMDFTHLDHDGVHLFNPRRRTRRNPPSPMKKYWRNIRNAIIVHSKRLKLN